MKVKMKFYIVLLNLLFLFTAVDAQPVLQYLHEGWSSVRRGALTGMGLQCRERFTQT